MSNPRSELKVGVFVLVGIVLLAGLLLTFSRGLSLFKPVYVILMKTTNVAGIQEGAAVAMLGVKVGSVKGVSIDPDGKTVTVSLQILSKYRIRRDARFVMEQAGFLGDQYVSILPGTDDAPFLEAGDVVFSTEPFNIQEMARSAAGLLQRVDNAAGTFNTLMERVDRLILNEQTLTNLSGAVQNFNTVSTRALAAVEEVHQLIENNSGSVAVTLTNLTKISEKLDRLSLELEQVLATNKAPLSATIKNLEATSAEAKAFLAEVREGKGVVGDFLGNEELKNQIHEVIQNLKVASSNVANYGLLFKPKKPKKARLQIDPAYPGRTPFR